MYSQQPCKLPLYDDTNIQMPTHMHTHTHACTHTHLTIRWCQANKQGHMTGIKPTKSHNDWCKGGGAGQKGLSGPECAGCRTLSCSPTWSRRECRCGLHGWRWWWRCPVRTKKKKKKRTKMIVMFKSATVSNPSWSKHWTLDWSRVRSRRRCQDVKSQERTWGGSQLCYLNMTWWCSYVN